MLSILDRRIASLLKSEYQSAQTILDILEIPHKDKPETLERVERSLTNLNRHELTVETENTLSNTKLYRRRLPEDNNERTLAHASVITDEHFKDKPKDMLDIIILESLHPTEPLHVWDIEHELKERGIPGYDRNDIHKRLNKFHDMHECQKGRSGYLKTIDADQYDLQACVTRKRIRKPNWIELNNRNIRKTTFINNGRDKREMHTLQLPPCAKVFATIYDIFYWRGYSEYVSHIYAFSLNDSPVIPVDLWYLTTDYI